MRRTTLIVLLTIAVLAAIVLFRAESTRGPGGGPAARFALGDRVHVTAPGFWADRESGSIAMPPSAVTELANGWRSHVRVLKTATGLQSFYWVKLDEPRREADGDGPYKEAEIGEKFLTPLVSK